MLLNKKKKKHLYGYKITVIWFQLRRKKISITTDNKALYNFAIKYTHFTYLNFLIEYI